jgi:hypothetical protein
MSFSFPLADVVVTHLICPRAPDSRIGGVPTIENASYQRVVVS